MYINHFNSCLKKKTKKKRNLSYNLFIKTYSYSLKLKFQH